MGRLVTSVKHGGGSITFINYKAVIKMTCSICGKEIKQGQEMYVIMANKQQFPNCGVHEKCTKPPAPFDKNNNLVWTAGQLAKSWKEAQQYKHWFVG